MKENGRAEPAEKSDVMEKRRLKTVNGMGVEAKLLLGLMTLAVIYTLHLAQNLLIPIALSFLVSLVLSPIVRRLEQIRIPRPIGAGLIILFLLSGFIYGVTESVKPIGEWVEQAPSLLRKLEWKVYPFTSTVEAVSETAEQVGRMASTSSKPTVEVQSISFRELLYSNAQQLIAGTAMATFLLYFLLAWGQTMLSRIDRLLLEHKSRHHFLALSAVVEGEVSKYLAIITLINIGLGVIVAGVLFVIGMPNPVLWGAIAALLNFMPYLGALITTVLLGASALLTFDGLALPALIVGSFLSLTVLEGQFITPLILGNRLALNPLVVFISVVFWFWLWGVLGALMAVPILITFKLIGDQIESWKPISVIAGR